MLISASKQQSAAGKSALAIGLEVANSKGWIVGVFQDPEEVKKEYENNIKNLKDALSEMHPTDKIQRRLKKLDNPDMKHSWVEHAPYILASAKAIVVELEESFRNRIRERGLVEGIQGNYEIVYANKLAVKRFDAQKMREWFGCVVCREHNRK